MSTPYWDRVVDGIRSEFPKFRVVSFDDSWPLRLLQRLGFDMVALSLWNTVYMHPEWIGKDGGAETLEHEAMHIRDQHRYHILFFLSYLVLPIGPSFKAFWEWRAYKIDLIRYWRVSKDFETEHKLGYREFYSDWVAQRFRSKTYLWMWPFRKHVRSFIDEFTGTLD